MGRVAFYSGFMPDKASVRKETLHNAAVFSNLVLQLQCSVLVALQD